MNTLNTQTHSSKEIAEFCFENADVKSFCYRKQRLKSKLSLSSECVETKLCKLCTSFTSHLHSSCGMLWYRTSRVKGVRQSAGAPRFKSRPSHASDVQTLRFFWLPCQTPGVRGSWRQTCQTTEHLLQSCPIYEPLRKGIWPDHTPVARKLYGSRRSLRCTATFIDETGVSI